MTTPVAPAAPVAAPVAPAAPTNGAAPPVPTKAEAPEPRIPLKVDKEEREYTRSELQKLLGKSAFADKLIQQAKDALKKTSEARAKAETETPSFDDDGKIEEYLRAKGVKDELLDKLARRRLDQRVKEAELTPEQKEAAALKAENERFKKAEAEREAEGKKTKQAAAEQRLYQQAQSQLLEAAQAAGFGPDLDSFDVLRGVVREWVELEMPWDPTRIVDEAQSRLGSATTKLQKEGLGLMDGAKLYEFLGPSVLKKLNDYQIQMLRSGKRPAQAAETPVRQTSPDEHLSVSDIAQRYRGGGG